MRDTAKGILKFLAIVLVIAGIAIGVLYAFFVKVVDVGHSAMAPTIMYGDRVLVWKSQSFERGEVALCPHPEEPNRFVMGRVVGQHGQTIAIERGQLRIDGRTPDADQLGVVDFDDAESGRRQRMRLAQENILDHDHMIFAREGTDPRMGRPHVVRGGIYLMNDNRTYPAEDSRTFGEVSPSTCVGRVFMRLTAAPSPPEVGNEPLDIIE